LMVGTHDESTFFLHDRSKRGWIHPSFNAAPQPKGEGDSIMVSQILVPEWGRLEHGN
ncbi:hypothetical protein C8J57DRAFT_993570, partial [Mycena rebaudengoi]